MDRGRKKRVRAIYCYVLSQCHTKLVALLNQHIRQGKGNSTNSKRIHPTAKDKSTLGWGVNRTPKRTKRINKVEKLGSGGSERERPQICLCFSFFFFFFFLGLYSHSTCCKSKLLCRRRKERTQTSVSTVMHDVQGGVTETNWHAFSFFPQISALTSSHLPSMRPHNPPSPCRGCFCYVPLGKCSPIFEPCPCETVQFTP